MTIGEVARQAGLAPSAIRYYEQEGLLPAPSRVVGRRVYPDETLSRLAFITFFRASGFTIGELRLLTAAGAKRALSPRLQVLAAARIRRIDADIERAGVVRQLLQASLRCRCLDQAECGRKLRKLGLVERGCPKTDPPKGGPPKLSASSPPARQRSAATPRTRRAIPR